MEVERMCEIGMHGGAHMIYKKEWLPLSRFLIPHYH